MELTNINAVKLDRKPSEIFVALEFLEYLERPHEFT